MARNNTRIAFTLAEVLITLGIIGVVSVLTLPNLMADYNKKTHVVQLQRVYNQLNNAFQNFMLDEEVDNLGDTYLSSANGEFSKIDKKDYDNVDDFNKARDEARTSDVNNCAGRFLKKYFRVTKDCGYSDANSCLAASYKCLNGKEGEKAAGYCVNINTGATICAFPLDGAVTPTMDLYVDTNGKSGPNTWGRDVFHLVANSKGMIAEKFDSNNLPYDISVDIPCAEANDPYEHGCFSKIVNDGWKMNY